MLLCQILILLRISLFDKIKNTNKTAWQPNPPAEKTLIVSWYTYVSVYSTQHNQQLTEKGPPAIYGYLTILFKITSKFYL